MMTPRPGDGPGNDQGRFDVVPGRNFASSLVNGTQMFTRGAAELTRLHGQAD